MSGMCAHLLKRVRYLSRVAFVVCLRAFTADLCVASKLVLYSFMEDSGQRSFEMTHASKKLPLDSHSDKSLVSFCPSGSPATARGGEVLMWCPGDINTCNSTYSAGHCRTSV